MSLRRSFTRSRRTNGSSIDRSSESETDQSAQAAASYRRHRGLGSVGISSSQITKPLQELEPWAVAETQSWVPPIFTDRKYKDVFGNIIQEPDLSNPFRSRHERPLDTIRSFEFAATGDRLQLRLMRASTSDTDSRNLNHSTSNSSRRMSQNFSNSQDASFVSENFTRFNYQVPRNAPSPSAVRYPNEAAQMATPPYQAGNGYYQHAPVQYNTVFDSHEELERHHLFSFGNSSGVPDSQESVHDPQSYTPPQSPVKHNHKRKSLKDKLKSRLSL